MNNENRVKELKRVYERCIETRNFEIQQLLHRNNFMLVFQAALFTAFSQLHSQSNKYNMIIIILGLVVSCFQIEIAAGAKFWQEYWEAKLSDIERKLKSSLPYNDDEFIYLFSIGGNTNNDRNAQELVRERLDISRKNILVKFLIERKFSVSTIPIYMGMVCLVVWVIMLPIDWSNTFSCIASNIN
ncbi:RipA family octameric membrane protein [Lonepinella sp. BR2882]|uniref:RipA family octameric membrane protein n=1 Tax=Lonepinella sp. BR2882 TaxID=3095283 RepID=UPI003F6DB7D1